MKIEKINDNQIRCTLTRDDLMERQIKLSELAYGSEKAKELFAEMMQQASYEFGFEAEDLPLMIEAIPLSADSIILVVTKVEYPEELDTRFSKFSEPDAQYLEEDALLAELGQVQKERADAILELFPKEGEKKKETKGVPFKKLFVFHSLEEVRKAACILDGFYHGVNDLYKVEATKTFYLFLNKSEETPENFNKVCNILSEYALPQTYSPSIEAYMKEHHRILLKERAIQTLALA